MSTTSQRTGGVGMMDTIRCRYCRFHYPTPAVLAELRCCVRCAAWAVAHPWRGLWRLVWGRG